MEHLADNAIVVRGTATRAVAPDRATMRLSIEVQDPSEREAFNQCSTRARELAERLRALIGEDGEVATAYVRLAPQWERRRHVGYEASTAITVRSAIEVAGRVAQAAVASAIVRVGGPYFEVSDPEAVRSELLGQALGAARHKAELLADAAGGRAGNVISIREEGLDGGFGHGHMLSASMASPLDADVVEPPVSAPEQRITSEVVAAFALIG